MSGSVRIKFCGIRSAEDAEAAVEAGAPDFLDGPRRLRTDLEVDGERVGTRLLERRGDELVLGVEVGAAARADALAHNYRPGVPERLGIDWETLREINPRRVYLYGASYGSTGPLSPACP